jgi:hypothetical protein
MTALAIRNVLPKCKYAQSIHDVFELIGAGWKPYGVKESRHETVLSLLNEEGDLKPMRIFKRDLQVVRELAALLTKKVK